METNRRFDRLLGAIRDGKQIGPERVMISPTDYCNLRCKTCWRLSKNEKYDELELAQIDSLLKECAELDVKVVDFTGGGEPFLRKDMFEILDLAREHGLASTLTTNGTLLDEDTFEKNFESLPDDICFSLDGHTAEINDSIRGGGAYAKATEAIRALERVKKRHSSETPTSRISTVITKRNYTYLDKIVELAAAFCAKSINFSILIEWGTNKELWMANANENDVRDALARASEACARLGVHSNIQHIINHGLFDHDHPKFCFAPWDMVFINASGDAMACCTLASLHENLLGNVKDDGLKKIWFGEKMEKLRDGIRSGAFHPDCRKCIPEFVDSYNDMYEWMRGSLIERRD